MGRKNGKKTKKRRGAFGLKTHLEIPAPAIPEKRSKWIALKWVLSVIAAAVIGLFITDLLANKLPGPLVKVEIQGSRATNPETLGCIAYLVVVTTKEPLEDFRIDIQLPSKINSARVGYSQKTLSPLRHDSQQWQYGKDETGLCVIKKAAVSDDPEVQSKVAENVISLHVSKMPVSPVIAGLILTNSNISSIDAPAAVFSEGTYEYSRFGLSVKKPIQAIFKGIKNDVDSRSK